VDYRRFVDDSNTGLNSSSYQSAKKKERFSRQTIEPSSQMSNKPGELE